jgi:hypothetical protein
MGKIFYCNTMSYKIDEQYFADDGMVCLINSYTKSKVYVQPKKIDGLSDFIDKYYPYIKVV